jgi:hypothetical protein
MEIAVAAIIAAIAAAVGIAVLLCVYRLITLLGDPVNAKLDERLAKLDEREKVERPWGSTSVGQSLRMEKAERPWGKDDPLN